MAEAKIIVWDRERPVMSKKDRGRGSLVIQIGHQEILGEESRLQEKGKLANRKPSVCRF